MPPMAFSGKSMLDPNGGGGGGVNDKNLPDIPVGPFGGNVPGGSGSGSGSGAAGRQGSAASDGPLGQKGGRQEHKTRSPLGNFGRLGGIGQRKSKR